MATNPYAVTNDVVVYMGQLNTPPADPECTRLIARACDLLDAYLVGVTYDVDVNGNPTDAVTVIPALKSAVCAQVEYWLSTGDELDELRQWMSTTVEGITLNRGGLKPPRIAPRALDHLRVAGLRTPLYPIHMP